MNRRLFIASLVAAPAVVQAAVTAAPVVTPPALDLNAIFDEIYKIRSNRLSDDILILSWMQTSRLNNSASMNYSDALDVAMGLPESECRANFHERRKEKARRGLALLKTQRPLPI